MHHLEELEHQSVFILREAFNKFENLAMLWSIGKDSTVLLWLARKAFFGHVPFPLVHIDTSYKIPSMIEYRDRVAQEWNLNLVVGSHKKQLESGMTYPNGKLTRVECCGVLKKDALKQVLECQTAVDDAINRALRSDNDTAFSVRCGIAGMNPNPFKVRHVQQ